MKLLELHPAPHEVALARVPAGMTVRAIREHADPAVAAQLGPVAAVLDLSPDEYQRYVQVPGGGFPWGAIWSTWYTASKVDNCRHKRDRHVWQKAARRLAGSPGSPAVVYVVHEQVQEHGKTVWAAVSIRDEEAGQ